ncbi:MAG: hypothetical protein IH874_04875 [Candidatus Dadabacteria bacterium]|nr:hypothetical protein [Candidatus Dadabacteria bacterium]
MAKKTITVEIYRCDYVDPEGNACTAEGERQAIRQCAMCKTDLCSRHYQMWQVSSQAGRTSLTYHFCEKHAEEFIETLVKTLGDTRPVFYAGMAK